MSKVDLRLDWCSHAAAKWACEHWHYSGTLPTPPLVKMGVWENDVFIGSVVFARGANKNLAQSVGVEVTECAELARVALDKHITPVTQIVAVALRMLYQHCQGLRVVISYADPNQGHTGAIYQAGNWLYLGQGKPSVKYRDNCGREWHPRQVSKTGWKRQYGEMRQVPIVDNCEKILQLGKHKYAMPFDNALQYAEQPYPKRAPDRGTSVPTETGGASPTRTLQNSTGNVATLEATGEVFPFVNTL